MLCLRADNGKLEYGVGSILQIGSGSAAAAGEVKPLMGIAYSKGIWKGLWLKPNDTSRGVTSLENQCRF